MIVISHNSFQTVLGGIKRPLLLLFIWDVGVTLTYYHWPFQAPGLPLTLFGSVLALILGFRSTSAYARWWEGRALWGAMINASRNLGRGVATVLPAAAHSAAAFSANAQSGGHGLHRAIVLRQIAYVNALRCQLRRLGMTAASLPDLPPAEAEQVLARANPANAILTGTGQLIAQAQRQGLIDTIQQMHLAGILVDMTNAQGGMERLKNTPLPAQFRVFPKLFTRLFCLLLPFGLVEALGPVTPLGSTVAGVMFLAVLAIGDDLVDPFGGTIHDLPLDAMCRTIEIDLLQGLGDEAPPAVTPDDAGVLW